MSNYEEMDNVTTLRRNDGAAGVSVPTVIFAIAAVIAGMSMQFSLFESDDQVPRYSDHVVPAPTDWQEVQSENRRIIKRLVSGEGKSSILSKLGQPDFTDGYGDMRGQKVEILFYRTRSRSSDGLTNKQTETTPVVLIGGKFVAAGRYKSGLDTSRVFTVDWEAQQERRDQYIRNLQTGSSLEFVQFDLGEPKFTEQVGDGVKILFYRTHEDVDDDSTSKRWETTPLVFLDEELVAIDYAAATEPVVAAPKSVETTVELDEDQIRPD
jgi:hypothetical protein|tara:strand:- start:1565 stop:2365 length:801 start_codon:yes stop_codon:yes gene_type:complete